MFKKVALSLAMSFGLAASASAFTSSVDFGLVNPGDIFSGFVTRHGSFDDQYKFTVGSSVFGSGTVTSSTLTSVYNISNFSAQLYFGDGTLLYDLDTNPASTSTYKFGEGLFSAGNYYFTVSGTTTGLLGGRYGYDVITAAVPEPETYAMMLAGLGLMGAMVRRRKQKSTAV